MNRFACFALSGGLSCFGASIHAQDGFCMVNGTTTGGAGGPTVTVTNGTDFNTQINIAGPRIIQVQGPITVGRVNTKANKTIIGLGTNAMLFGNLNISDSTGATNVIVRNLRISNPGGDGLTIWNTRNVWIDHCTFIDCGDGSCDMNRGSQYVTVSWCKFIYPTQLEHRFTMIADGYANGGVTNWGWYTLHHNWWSTRADQRMPASSYGRLHMYNNYFSCTNNSYSSNARCETEIRSEQNFYAGVKSPLYKECSGKINANGNIYVGTTGNAPDAGLDAVFVPPYAYTLDAAANVPALVMAGAGAPGPDWVDRPAKVWTGGGGNNNLTTSGNWSFTEAPKLYDTFLFAGSTRLTPNNNYTANSEFNSLNFNNNAGAFVLAGNALNLGFGITNDSAATQTVNLNVSFAWGIDHYTSNRFVHITDPNGVVLLNGQLNGPTNTYGRLYLVSKSGPGLLALGGVNSVAANYAFYGGLVRFSTLDPALPGSLGFGASLAFHGGGLQWAAGNTADITTRSISLQANGAILDVGPNAVTFANPFGSSSSGGLTKLGSGSLTLNGSNPYSGATVIAAGTLALNGAGNLPNSARLILSNNAVLDVAARSDATLTVGAGKSLSGAGTVRGSVIAASGATIAPGFFIGVLTITNTLTFQAGSTNVMELNASALTNDVLNGMTSVTYGGRLMVTNFAGTFAAGQSFKLFQAANYLGGFTSLSLPVLPANLNWTNRLALDGTIAVVATVNTNPTNLGFLIGSNALQLNWPADHVGWRLEAQTNNNTEGLSSNWFNVGGSASTNAVVLPLDRAAGNVFFRLVYP